MWGRTGGTLWSKRAHSRVWIQRVGKHVMFREPNSCIYFLCNILYCIVESFSLIRGRRHGWQNHIKTLCTVCVIVLSLCSWTNIVSIKAFTVTTDCSIVQFVLSLWGILIIIETSGNNCGDISCSYLFNLFYIKTLLYLIYTMWNIICYY